MIEGLLPERARRILMDAAAIPSTSELERRKAVDKAIERVKREFPAYFRENDDGNDSGGSE